MITGNQQSPPMKEIDVLWITAGLGCDGDTIAMTAATQPSIEDIVRAGFPGSPRSTCTIPFSPPKTAMNSCAAFTWPPRARWSHFILVVEGSIPNENNKAEGYWASFGTDAATGPADHDLRMDRPARAAGLGGDRCRHLRHLWRHPCDGGQSHRLHGPARLPRVGLEVERQISRSSACRGARCSRTTSWRRCSTCFTWPPDARR